MANQENFTNMHEYPFLLFTLTDRVLSIQTLIINWFFNLLHDTSMSLIHSSTQQYHDQISQHSISIYYVSIRFQAFFGLKPELTQIHLLQSHIRHIHPTPFLHTFLCTCDRISPAATRPRSDFSSSSPLLAGLSASTPSSDSLLHVFSTLIASHII